MSKKTPHILHMPCKTKMTLMVIALAVTVAVVAVAAMEAAAETNGPSETILSSAVELGAITLFRFHQPFKGASPQERANTVYKRLWHVLDSTAPEKRLELPDQVRVTQVKADTCIFIGDYLIVTIDDIHARLNRCSPQELAEVWADNLRRGLSRYLDINAPKPVPES